MGTKSKCLMALIFLGIVDVLIPLPILGLFLIYVVLQRPPWFMDVAKEIYGTA